MTNQQHLDLALTGNKHIELFVGNDEFASNRSITRLCLIGSWAALLNCARKGDAVKIETVGVRAFSEEEWTSAIDEALEACGLDQREKQMAKDGFKRIDIAGFLGEVEDMVDKELAKELLIGSMAGLINLKRSGETGVLVKIGVQMAGEKGWNDTVRELLADQERDELLAE